MKSTAEYASNAPQTVTAPVVPLRNPYFGLESAGGGPIRPSTLYWGDPLPHCHPNRCLIYPRRPTHHDTLCHTFHSDSIIPAPLTGLRPDRLGWQWGGGSPYYSKDGVNP
jgi:hypothetical protein